MNRHELRTPHNVEVHDGVPILTARAGTPILAGEFVQTCYWDNQRNPILKVVENQKVGNQCKMRCEFPTEDEIYAFYNSTTAPNIINR